MADTPLPPVSLGDVLNTEHDEIMAVRRRRLAHFDQGSARPIAEAPNPSVPRETPFPVRLPSLENDNPAWAETIRAAHESNFVGLAFSGGGIRSATFNLGILQALADLKLLCRIDYLSTVSGGGYIGSWMAAWTQRLGSFAKLQENISTHRVHLKEDREQTPLRFLRVFSNYLTPKLGFFSGDTWAMIAIYLRNLLLNQSIVIALLASLLLVPRVVNQGIEWFLRSPYIGIELLIIGVFMLFIAFVFILINMGYLGARQTTPAAPRLTEQKLTLLLVSAPLFATALVAALWLLNKPNLPFESTLSTLSTQNLSSIWQAVLCGALAYSAIWGSARLVDLLRPKQALDGPPPPSYPFEWVFETGASLCAGALAGGLLALLYPTPLFQHRNEALTFGVPLIVTIFLLAGVLHIGLMGLVFHDWKREWWGRLGGWLLLFAILWLALFALALFFPHFIKTNAFVQKTWGEIAAKYLTPAWILSTAGTVLGGNSTASGKPGSTNWLDTAIKVGPYVFVVGLLGWISFVIEYFLKTPGKWDWALLICAVVALIMAWRVDINQFSMHMFYRNRLVGCFLGASHTDRVPNRFTGFDPLDDLALIKLRSDAAKPYDGPYPVINSSLNLVKGKDLAWQERKAESFIMTPHYCGYDVWLEEQDSPMLKCDGPSGESKTPGPAPANAANAPLQPAAVPQPQAMAANVTPPEPLPQFEAEIKAAYDKTMNKLDRFGYCRTEDYAFPINEGFDGPRLGLAMAISGAAVSPNMGFYSSTPVAFLMTIFNVRLGQWLGNPRHRTASRRATPRLGLWCLINELLGGTNDQSAYVYLSDGGHFENMGLYELVKRRCGLIIVCDAEQDEAYKFCGLGNAIRKCRTDLGVDIDLDTSKISPKDENTPSEQHCAIGKIHYENADQAARTGTIVYFKASLTGDESSDVRNYKKEHATFPHESTADQWFTESQFESYRELGYHQVVSSIKGIPPDQDNPPASPKPLQEDLNRILKELGIEIDSAQPEGLVIKPGLLT